MNAPTACALLLVVAALSSCSAQELIFNTSGVMFPGGDDIGPLGDIVVPAGTNSSTGVVVTLTSTPCKDDAGTQCASTGAGDNVTGLELLCGNNAMFSDISANSDFPYNSARVSGQQVIQISPNSTNYKGAAEGEEPSFSCLVRTTGGSVIDWLAKPIAYQLNATLEPVVHLNDSQQATAATLFEACCSAAGSCAPWLELASQAGDSEGEVFTDLCDMDNAQCDAQGNLVALNLAGYDLACDLAQVDFSNFTQLQYLYLDSNQLTGDIGEITTELSSSLPLLRELDVSRNADIGGTLGTATTAGVCDMVKEQVELFGFAHTGVTGSLPSCMFAAASTLRQLFASSTGLTGGLTALQDTSPLEVVELGDTGLTGTFPESLGASLRALNLSHTALGGPLGDLSAAESLVILDVSHSSLSAVGDSLADRAVLRWVDLSDTKVKSLPAPWLDDTATPANSPALTMLDLDNTPLEEESFPIGLSAYPNLTTLSLRNASLTGDLPDVGAGGFAALLNLLAGENELTGTIPDGWQDTGVFAQTAAAMQAVRTFSLPNNSLSGELPAWLGEAYPTSLTIDLLGNDFSNGCDAEFATRNTCNEAQPAEAPAPAADAPEGEAAAPPSPDYEPPAPEPPAPGPSAVDPESTDGGDGGGGGGLSSGDIAAIVVVLLLVAGGGLGFWLWRRSRTGGGTSFQRFQDEGGLELGPTRGGAQQGHSYDPSLAPQ